MWLRRGGVVSTGADLLEVAGYRGTVVNVVAPPTIPRWYSAFYIQRV